MTESTRNRPEDESRFDVIAKEILELRKKHERDFRVWQEQYSAQLEIAKDQIDIVKGYQETLKNQQIVLTALFEDWQKQSKKKRKQGQVTLVFPTQ